MTSPTRRALRAVSPAAGLEPLESRRLLSVDLDLLRLNLSSGSIGPGEPLGVSLAFMNTGTRANRPMNVEARLSRDRVWGNADDLVLRSGRLDLVFPPDGEEYELSNDDVLPAGLPPGRYRVAYRFDTQRTTGDSDYSNNTRFSARFRLRAEAKLEIRGRGRLIADTDAPLTGKNTNFGNAPADNARVDRAFIIENTGNAPMHFGDPSVGMTALAGDLAGFSIVRSPSGTLEPGERARLKVRFDPSVGGRVAATLWLRDQDGHTVRSFRVKANGLAPAIGIAADEPASAVSATQFLASPSFGINTFDQAFTLTNTGAASMTVGPVSITLNPGGAFEVAQQPGMVLQPGAATTFILRLTGPLADWDAVDLTFTTNIPGSEGVFVRLSRAA